MDELENLYSSYVFNLLIRMFRIGQTHFKNHLLQDFGRFFIKRLISLWNVTKKKDPYLHSDHSQKIK